MALVLGEITFIVNTDNLIGGAADVDRIRLNGAGGTGSLGRQAFDKLFCRIESGIVSKGTDAEAEHKCEGQGKGKNGFCLHNSSSFLFLITAILYVFRTSQSRKISAGRVDNCLKKEYIFCL